jgi:hypothetical protein
MAYALSLLQSIDSQSLTKKRPYCIEKKGRFRLSVSSAQELNLAMVPHTIFHVDLNFIIGRGVN